jgi:hypothetical protein
MLNDFIVSGMTAVGSFASGGLLAVYDWTTVLRVLLVPSPQRLPCGADDDAILVGVQPVSRHERRVQEVPRAVKRGRSDHGIGMAVRLNRRI